MKKVLAFDIGGTKIAHALVNEDGQLLAEPVKEKTPDTVQEIEKLLKKNIQQYEAEIDAVAIATAGGVNPENSKIVSPVSNLPQGYDALDFQNLSSKPVFLENDANAVAWAEYRKGAGEGCRHVVVVAIGTGLGLGIIVDGVLLKGKSGVAGEAHYPINLGRKRKCGCGAYDCFEIYASGKALALDAQEAFNDPQMTSYELIKLLEKGNPLATSVFNRWCSDIIVGIRGLATLFDPEMVVLFGSLVEFIDTEKMEKEANKEIITNPFKLKRAKFGNNAALIGAALRTFDKMKKNN